MKTRILTTLGLFGALALGAAPTIPNPSFEANSFTIWPGYISSNSPIAGWTTTNPDRAGLNPASGNPFANNGSVPDGTNVAFIQSDPNSSLSTDISGLTAGENYEVNFRVNARRYLGTTANLKVDMAGTNVLNTTVTSVGGVNPYQYLAFVFTATAATQTMTLRNDAPGDHTVLLDDFTIGVAPTIPNPSFESNHFTVWPGYISSNSPITGWTTTNPNRAGLNPASSSPFADNGLIPYGSNVAFIQSDPNSSLSTVISNLAIGRTYKVNFRVNARSSFGGTPNLKVSIDGTNIIDTVVTPVGGASDYKYFAFDFTAAAASQIMTLSNDAGGDQTVLLDDFSIAPRNSGWSYAAWTNDASSGVVAASNYTHAYHFGTNNVTTINGVNLTGIAGGNPSVGGAFSTAGLPYVANNDTNNLTAGAGGSAVLAHDFLWGGSVESITINGLVVGKSYVATLYSVGWDTNGARAATFSVGNDRLTVNQDQFGNNNGIRVSYSYTAGSSRSITLTYVPLSDYTFHTYGFGNYELPNANYHATLLVVTNLNDSGPGTLRQAIADAEPGETITFAANGTIRLATGLIISQSLNIAGPGPASLVVNGNGQPYSVFNVSGNTNITDNISGLTIENGLGGGGGGIQNHSTLTLSNCVITANRTLSGINVGGGGGQGGGIWNDGVLTLTACTVSDNRTGDGANGATGADGSYPLHTDGYNGDYGKPGGDGGGLYNLGTLTLIASTVVNNATGNGGHGGTGGQGITGLPIVSDGNGGLGGPGGIGGYGGGILNRGTLVLSNCTLYGNSVGNGGGGGDGGTLASFFVTGKAGNGGTGGKSGDGGAICNYNFSSLGVLVMTACSVYTNRVGVGGAGGAGGQIAPLGAGTPGNPGSPGIPGNGGGIINKGGALTLNKSVLSGNSATDGGGIFADNLCTTTLSNCTLYGNSASYTGGGVENEGGSTFIANNSTLYGNSASYTGAGIENASGCTFILNNSTFSGNSAQYYSGIANYGALFLTNVISAGNRGAIDPDMYSDPTTGSLAGANNISSGNPLLAPLGNYGGPTPTMPPLHGSPAIGAGSDSVTNFLATDQRGFPRRSGTHVDIGAVEAQVAPANNPPLLTNPAKGSDGAVGFRFTNVPVADFTVLTSTNVALPLGQWSILGAPVQYVPGQYQFTDSSATNYPRRFYQVVSP